MVKVQVLGLKYRTAFDLFNHHVLLTSTPPIMSFDTDVLIVGGGPAGLLTALTLAVHGTKCILVERNRETTQWPKMDLTNCRSMEILRRLGVADGWREIGVPTSYDLAVHFSTGLVEGGETIAKWVCRPEEELRHGKEAESRPRRISPPPMPGARPSPKATTAHSPSSHTREAPRVCSKPFFGSNSKGTRWLTCDMASNSRSSVSLRMA